MRKIVRLTCAVLVTAIAVFAAAAGPANALMRSEPCYDCYDTSGGGGSTSSTSGSSSNTYQVYETSLEATDLEDNAWYWWDDTDETSVNYNSSRVFSGSVKLNQPVTLSDSHFTGSALRVDLYEWDGGKARHLGTQYLSTTPELLGDEQTLQFGRSNSDGFEYLFRAKVKSV